LVRKVYSTKAIALVGKIDYMIQKRQIVKALGKQVDIEDPRYVKYVFISFHYLDLLRISVIVTIYRTNASTKGFQSSHFISTAKLRRSM
jgi:hypothetical protein